jgi:hypothetical protein
MDTSGTYIAFINNLKDNTIDPLAAVNSLNVNESLKQRTATIYGELIKQQELGMDQYWGGGVLASNKAAAAEMAWRMAEGGAISLKDLGQRTTTTKQIDPETGSEYSIQNTEYYSKTTGEAMNMNMNSGALKLIYNFHVTDDGMVIPYATKRSSDWVQFRDNVAKPIAAIALAAYGVPYVSTAIAGTTVAGVTLTAGSALTTGVATGLVSGGASLLSGNDFETALKSALTSGLTAGATAGYADTIGQTLGFDAGSVAAKAAGNAIIAGAKAGITDENILQSMATAAVATYLSNKTPAIDATEREGSLAKVGVDDGMTTDFGLSADYSLVGNLKFPSTEGVAVDNRGVGEGFELTGGTTPFDGLQPTTSNLTAMGGGQGITATKDDGSTLAGKDFTTGLSAKDIKTAIKVGGVLMASDEVVDITFGNNNTATQNKDIYRDAPLAGFRMVKYEDPSSGTSKYVPFVGEEALLPPPSGYTKAYAKGGFVSKRKSEKTGKSTSFVTRQT